VKKLFICETAVSDALGFILTLGVVMLASGIVYTGALPILQDSMKSCHFQEMDESFMLVGQNINEVAYERAPIRNTELKILQGSMSIQHDSRMLITVNGTTQSFGLGSLEYYLDNQIIAYENGGIWVKYKNNDTLIRSKPHINYANVTTIPVVELVGTYSKGGEGTARIRAKRSDASSTYFFNTTGYTTTIAIKSNFYKGWESYLKNDVGANDITLDETNRTVSANLTASSVFVDINKLNVEIF
jgi:hypothetical protein